MVTRNWPDHRSPKSGPAPALVIQLNLPSPRLVAIGQASNNRPPCIIGDDHRPTMPAAHSDCTSESLRSWRPASRAANTKSVSACPRNVSWRSPSRCLARRFAKPSLRWNWIAWSKCASAPGVYVMNTEPPGGKAGATDIGPFELLEARRSIEGEACALAATPHRRCAARRAGFAGQ